MENLLVRLFNIIEANLLDVQRVLSEDAGGPKRAHACSREVDDVALAGPRSTTFHGVTPPAANFRDAHRFIPPLPEFLRESKRPGLSVLMSASGLVPSPCSH